MQYLGNFPYYQGREMGKAATKDVVSRFKGIFTLRVKDSSGSIVHEYTDDNMIVNGSKELLAELISDPEKAADCHICRFGVGTGGGSSASPDDTSLSTPYIKNVDRVYVADGGNGYKDRAVYEWSLGYDEPNRSSLKPYSERSGDADEYEDTAGISESGTMAITEFGLFTRNNVMFSHKVRDVISKDQSLSFEGTWTIIF